VPSDESAFAELRQRVLADPELQAALLEPADQPTFVTVAVELAAANGLDVSAAELEARILDERRRWHLRWV
jgi:hypothetical protein